ncbi:mCG147580 [Mus musculus]|nr:mCG147580 [Mus musculus]
MRRGRKGSGRGRLVRAWILIPGGINVPCLVNKSVHLYSRSVSVCLALEMES